MNYLSWFFVVIYFKCKIRNLVLCLLFIQLPHSFLIVFLYRTNALCRGTHLCTCVYKHNPKPILEQFKQWSLSQQTIYWTIRWPVQIVLVTFVVEEMRTDFCLQLDLYVPKSMNSFWSIWVNLPDKISWSRCLVYSVSIAGPLIVKTKYLHLVSPGELQCLSLKKGKMGHGRDKKAMAI